MGQLALALLLAAVAFAASPAHAKCDTASGWPPGKPCRDADQVGLRIGAADKSLQESVEDGDLVGGGGMTKTVDVSWKAPVVGDDVFVKVSAGPITLLGLDCIATGATTPSAFVVTIDECTSGGASCVSSGGTVTLSALTTNTADTTFTDAVVDDNDWIRLDVTSLTTAPDYAHCRLEYVQS